jgi:hypothetical protein
MCAISDAPSVLLARRPMRKTGSTFPSEAQEHFQVKRIRFTVENASEAKTRTDST